MVEHDIDDPVGLEVGSFTEGPATRRESRFERFPKIVPK